MVGSDDAGGPVAQFEAFVAGRGPRDPAWLGRLRQESMDHFRRVGWPTKKMEEWKYTDVAPIAKTPFRLRNGSPHSAPVGLLESARIPGLEAHEFVFIDGRYDAAASRPGRLPAGVTFQPLAQALLDPSAQLNERLGRIATPTSGPFVALNGAFFEDGAFLHLAPGAAPDRPFHLVFLSTGGPGATSAHPRVFVHVGDRAHLHLIESHMGPADATYVVNAVTELVLDEGAVVDHTKLQRESEGAFHVHRIEVRQGRDSHYRAFTGDLGGRLVRNELHQRFEAEGGECVLNGLYVARGTEHVDNHTFIDHAVPHCTSREFYKGILDGTSHAVFYGKVLVRKDAQKTNARQNNKNLLLTDGALADSTPALEINANDVKCNHGSSIGQLDRDALFYLRARGVDETTARSLLTFGFARDLLSQVELAPLRAKLDDILLGRLPNGPAVRETLYAP